MLQMVNPSKSLYSTEQAVQWLTEIGEALQYMHTLTPAVSQHSQLPIVYRLCCLLALVAGTCPAIECCQHAAGRSQRSEAGERSPQYVTASLSFQLKRPVSVIHCTFSLFGMLQGVCQKALRKLSCLILVCIRSSASLERTAPPQTRQCRSPLSQVIPRSSCTSLRSWLFCFGFSFWSVS